MHLYPVEGTSITTNSLLYCTRDLVHVQPIWPSTFLPCCVYLFCGSDWGRNKNSVYKDNSDALKEVEDTKCNIILADLGHVLTHMNNFMNTCLYAHKHSFAHFCKVVLLCKSAHCNQQFSQVLHFTLILYRCTRTSVQTPCSMMSHKCRLLQNYKVMKYFSQKKELWFVFTKII